MNPRRAAGMFAFVAAALVAGAHGCKRHGGPAKPSARATIATRPAPAWALGGCRAVDSGPVCRVTPGDALTLWFDVPPSRAPTLRWGEGARAAQVQAEPVDGGVRLRARVPAGAAVPPALVARAHDGAWRWSVALAAYRPVEAVDNARALRAQGRLDEARAVLEAARRKATPAQAAAIDSMLARVALSQGRYEEAARMLAAAQAVHARAGRWSAAWDDGFARAFVAMEMLRRFDEAARALDALTPVVARWPAARASAAAYRGLLNLLASDLRGALAPLQEATRWLWRVDARREWRYAAQELAEVFANLGRLDEAVELMDRVSRSLDADEADACERANQWTNEAWLRLLACEGRAGEPCAALRPARAALRRALALYGPEGGCNRADLRANALLNAALADVLAGDIAAAARHLDEARRIEERPPAWLAGWWLDVEARIATARGKVDEALAALERLDLWGQAVADPDARWRAAVGRAEALHRADRQQEAVAAWRQAEGLLDQLMLRVPLGGVRHGFLARRSRGTRGLVAALLEAGDVAEAARVARHARRRALEALWRAWRIARLDPTARARWERAMGRYRALREALEAQARGDWALPADALRRAIERRREQAQQVAAALDEAFAAVDLDRDPSLPLPPIPHGTVRLLYVPLADGWVGFAMESAGVHVARIGAWPGPGSAREAQAAALLGPFDAAIERNGRVEVVAWDERVDDIDFEALPWRGEPLVTRRVVARSLDLPPRAEARASAPDKALVVGNPTGDLAPSAREARTVAAGLRGVAGSVELLVGEEATRARVWKALVTADLFTYAGHGVAPGDRGADDSALPLAGAEALTASDVLAAPAVPAVVLLDACETAASAGRRGRAGLSLARALVARGARGVIATSRPVSNELSEAFANALSSGDANAAALDLLWRDPAAALRRALVALHRSGRADWPAYRAILP